MKKILFITGLFCLVVTGAGCSRESITNPINREPDPTNGRLLKGATNTTVYFLGADNKRYVFPTDKTYLSWFPSFKIVRQVPDEELYKYPLGGNVTYKPASRLLKIDTDPKVYAVTRGGTLRWIKSDEAATALFGENWKTQVDDLPDAFFTNYTLGTDITSKNDFSPVDEGKNAVSINYDKGLATTTTP